MNNISQQKKYSGPYVFLGYLSMQLKPNFKGNPFFDLKFQVRDFFNWSICPCLDIYISYFFLIWVKKSYLMMTYVPYPNFHSIDQFSTTREANDFYSSPTTSQIIQRTRTHHHIYSHFFLFPSSQLEKEKTGKEIVHSKSKSFDLLHIYTFHFRFFMHKSGSILKKLTGYFH